MRNEITITAPEGPLAATVGLPPSKSVANRALVLASLAGNLSLVHGHGDADDTRILHQLLRQQPAELHCGDGGTTLRFLLAWACVQEGRSFHITGSPRLMQRPHAALVKALQQLGAEITAVPGGFSVKGKRMHGGSLRMHAPPSSQFISALLLVATRFTDGLELQWTGMQLSRPYVHMTVELCRRFGAHVQWDQEGIAVQPGPLSGVPVTVPADWSAASFWYQAAALAPGSTIALQGLYRDGLQGDQAIEQLFAPWVHTSGQQGQLVLRSAPAGLANFEADLIHTPDLFQPLAFAMAGLGVKARFTGLHNLPLKETDRLKAVQQALEQLGCAATAHNGTFTIRGKVSGRANSPFDPQGDHRMAMALAPLALVVGRITISHPEVVAKSYPGFWREMEAAGFKISQ